MSVNLDDRIDALERKLHALQGELEELRALAAASRPATAQPLAAIPPPRDETRSALQALAEHIRIAVADEDAAALRRYAAEVDKLAPSATPTWQAYASRLAAYAREVAGPEPVSTAPSAVTTRLRALADGVRRAEADGNASLLRDMAGEAAQLAPAAPDLKWRTYALQLATYAESAAAAAALRPRTATAAQTTRPEATAPVSVVQQASREASPARRQRTFTQLVEEWDLLGARGVALAGGVVTLLGIIFFFVLATNRGWIGPTARVSLGAAASLLVFTAGLVVHRRYGQLHAALAACGTGIAGGYATLAAATILYGLLPPVGALVAASAIAAAGVLVALAWSSQALAALAFLGAALAPAALGLDEGVSAAGTAFAAVVFAALAVVSVRRSWQRLLVAGSAVTVTQVVWMVGAAEANDAAATAVAAIVAALLVGAAAAWQLAMPREGLDGLAASLSAAAVATLLGSALHLYPNDTEQALALFAAAAGLGLAAALVARRAADLAYVLGAGALLLAGVGTADLLAGASLAAVFAAQSILATTISHRLRERRFLLGAYAYLGIALVEATLIQADWADGIAPDAAAAAGLAACAAAALTAGLLAPSDAQSPSSGVLAALRPVHEWLGRQRVNLRALLASAAFALAAVAVSDVLSGAWLVVAWSAAAMALAVAAWRYAELRLVLFALTAALLAAGHAVVVEAPVDAGFDGGADAAIALVAAAAASLLVGLLAPSGQRGISRLGSLADAERALARLADSHVELRALLASLAAALLALATANVLSDTWLVVAFAAGSVLLTLPAARFRELRLVPFGLAAGSLAGGHALLLDAPLVPELHPELSAGLDGAAAVAAAAAAIGLAALLLPSEQRGIALLGELDGPERSLQWLVRRRRDVRAVVAGVAAVLALGAAALALADLLGDAGHVVAVALWAAAGLAAVAFGSRHSAPLAWAGAGLLGATLIKAAGHDWTTLGTGQAALELLLTAAAILAAGWLARALSPSRQPVAVASAVASGVALASALVAVSELTESDRAEGLAAVGIAVVYGLLAAAAQRKRELRNLSTAMWVPGLIALLLGEALLLHDRNVAVAYAATAVALAATARAIDERRLQWAAIVLLGGNTAVTLVALTPPSHLIEASEHPGTSGWTIAACAVAWGVIAALEPRLRERLGWLAAALGLYTASLVILEAAERVSGASAQTDFERGHTAVSALWGAVGLGLLVAGLLRDSRALRLGGLALFGISLVKLFLYDLSTLSSVTRAFSFLAVGAILLTGGFFLQKLSRRLDQPPPASQP